MQNKKREHQLKEMCCLTQYKKEDEIFYYVWDKLVDLGLSFIDVVHYQTYIFSLGEVPTVITYDSHFSDRASERIPLYKRKDIVGLIVKNLENNEDLSMHIIDESDKFFEAYPKAAHRMIALYLEEQNMFFYIHFYENGRVQIATVYSHPFKPYYVKQNALALAVMKNGDVVKGIENISRFEISTEKKFNRI